MHVSFSPLLAAQIDFSMLFFPGAFCLLIILILLVQSEKQGTDKKKDGHEEECTTGWQRRVGENEGRGGGEKTSKIKRSKDNRIEMEKSIEEKRREKSKEELQRREEASELY